MDIYAITGTKSFLGWHEKKDAVKLLAEKWNMTEKEARSWIACIQKGCCVTRKPGDKYELMYLRRLDERTARLIGALLENSEIRDPGEFPDWLETNMPYYNSGEKIDKARRIIHVNGLLAIRIDEIENGAARGVLAEICGNEVLMFEYVCDKDGNARVTRLLPIFSSSDAQELKDIMVDFKNAGISGFEESLKNITQKG